LNYFGHLKLFRSAGPLSVRGAAFVLRDFVFGGMRFIALFLRRRWCLWYRHLRVREFTLRSMALGHLGWIAELD